jgi:hypothetical protein
VRFVILLSGLSHGKQLARPRHHVGGHRDIPTDCFARDVGKSVGLYDLAGKRDRHDDVWRILGQYGGAVLELRVGPVEIGGGGFTDEVR